VKPLCTARLILNSSRERENSKFVEEKTALLGMREEGLSMDGRKRIVFESDEEYFENLRKFLIFIEVNRMTDSVISRDDEIPDSLIHQWVDLTVEEKGKEY